MEKLPGNKQQTFKIHHKYAFCLKHLNKTLLEFVIDVSKIVTILIILQGLSSKVQCLLSVPKFKSKSLRKSL